MIALSASDTCLRHNWIDYAHAPARTRLVVITFPSYAWNDVFNVLKISNILERELLHSLSNSNVLLYACEHPEHNQKNE